MSHKALNPVNPQRPKRVAIVLSNPAVSTTTGWPVGFWWAELTHPYFQFTEAGYQVEIFSPKGGRCEADAMSNPEDASQWQAEDVISRGYLHDPEFRSLSSAPARSTRSTSTPSTPSSSSVGRARCSRSTPPRTCTPSSTSSRGRQSDGGTLPRRRHPQVRPPRQRRAPREGQDRDRVR
jgi:hypothetical protein